MALTTLGKRDELTDPSGGAIHVEIGGDPYGDPIRILGAQMYGRFDDALHDDPTILSADRFMEKERAIYATVSTPPHN